MHGQAMMPFSYGPWGPAQLVQQQKTESPPPRIRVAMEFLTDLTIKTAPRVAANDMGFHEIDPQKLTLPETQAMNAACLCLTDYFKGELRPDRYENNEQRYLPENVRGPGTILRCIRCGVGGVPDATCIVCNGSGSVLIFPTGTHQEG